MTFWDAHGLFLILTEKSAFRFLLLLSEAEGRRCMRLQRNQLHVQATG